MAQLKDLLVTGPSRLIGKVYADEIIATTFTGYLNGNAASASRLNISSTDNAIARFNGTNGTIQNSSVTIEDSGSVYVNEGDGIYFKGANNLIAAFKLTSASVARDNIDMGWEWSSIGGAGAAFRSSASNGQFIFFARTKNSDGNAVYTQLIGTPGSATNGGTLSWAGRTVVTGSSVGSNTVPVYIDSSGHPQTITSYSGNAATATKLNSTGTMGQFWRGDNTWSNVFNGTFNISYNNKIVFYGANNNTSPCAQMGYANTLSGGKMHSYNDSNSYQTDGAFYIWSNGCNAGNDNGGIAIDNEGVTVFGAGDAGSNFTGVFRVINEDNIAAGPVFLVTKAGLTTAKNTIHAEGGYLKSTMNNKVLQMGSQNTDWCHMETTADKFYFNKHIQAVTGFTIYNTGNNNWRNGYLQVNNSDGGDCYLELLRATNADWKMLNSGGNLYFQSDYTTAKGSYFNVLQLNYDSGNITVNKGGIIAQHGHNFIVGGNEFNCIPDNYNSTMWFNYQSFSRNSSSTVTSYTFGNGHGGVLATISSGQFSGNSATATEFNSNATVTLTGDTTGTSAGSKKSWSIATTTTKLSQTTATALSSFTDSVALIYTAAGGSNTITDKPTSVDAFGCLSFKTASGWYGQLLISSNTATGLYWRTATSLSGNWKKILDSTNYTDYTVTKTGSGASGSWGISITGSSASCTGNAATANNINTTLPTLATATENNEIKVIDLGNSVPASGEAHRHAIDFRWYNTHWAIGNLRGGSSNSVGFGVSYTPDGTTWSTKWKVTPDGYTYATRQYNAVWNDYAEHRKTIGNIQLGQVVSENGNGEQHITQYRLELGANITSDTFGTTMNETPDSQTPIAVAGRVLAYINGDINDYKPGDAVCSGPNGTVSKMTRREIRRYPDAIIGYVSEIPDYEIWYAGDGNTEIKVNGRIWIKVN